MYELADSGLTHEKQILLASHKDSPVEKINGELGKLDQLLVTVTVEGSSGEKFTIIPDADLEKNFSLLNLPNRITHMRFDNWSNFQVFHQRSPNFSVTLDLDFRDIDLLKFSNGRDFNGSRVEVRGPDETWVSGAIDRIARATQSHSTFTALFFHRLLKYDLALWIVGMPTTFWALKKISGVSIVERTTGDYPPGLAPVAYLTLGLLLLIFFKFVHSYLRWLFPYMEIEEQPKKLQFIQRGLATFFGLGILSGWLSIIADALLKIIR